MIAQVTAHTHEATHTHKPHALKLAAQGGGSKCASSRRSSRALPPAAASTVKLHIRRALPLQSEIVWCDSKIYTTKRGEGELNRLLSSKTENRHQARSSSRRAPPAPRPASGACAFTVKFSHTQGTSARVFVTNFFDKRYGNMSRAAARGRRAFGIQADRVRLRETPRAKARRLAALDHRLNAQRRRSLRRSW